MELRVFRALDAEHPFDHAPLTPQAHVFVISYPNNPTGWMMSAVEQRRVLEQCRKHGIWIVANDVCARLCRHTTAAPSFLSLAEPEDRLLSINSCSKCWSMSGWRLSDVLDQLNQFNTSCTPSFVQYAGIVALRDGEEEVVRMTTRVQSGYAIAAERLASFSRVEFVQPDAAFYLFLKADQMQYSLQVVFDIMRHAKMGLALGIAFGEDGAGFLRLCHAQPPYIIEQAFDRLEPLLSG